MRQDKNKLLISGATILIFCVAILIFGINRQPAPDIMHLISLNYQIYNRATVHGDDDRVAAQYIDAGRERDAIKILLESIDRDEKYGDNAAVKSSSLRTACNDSSVFYRYLHTIDTLSLLFRLGERIGLSEPEMKKMLSHYMQDINDPKSIEDYVVALEYRLSFRHLEDIDKLLARFKKYLHEKSWDCVGESPFLYYYPYLMGRLSLLRNNYNDAEQYLGLALLLRPEGGEIAYSDLAAAYMKMGQDKKAEYIVKALLDKPRGTPEFMFFRSSYRKYYEH